MARLTENEFKVLRAIDLSEYGDSIRDAVWTWSMSDYSGMKGKEISGVVSSLVQKGYVYTSDSGRDASIEMTAAGVAAYVAAAPKGSVNKWVPDPITGKYPGPKKDPRPSVDQSLLSPSGKVSKRAQKAALARTASELFPPGYWDAMQAGKSAAEKHAMGAAALRRTAAQLRDLAARGMKPRAYLKQAEAFERQAVELEMRKQNPRLHAYKESVNTVQLQNGDKVFSHGSLFRLRDRAEFPNEQFPERGPTIAFKTDYLGPAYDATFEEIPRHWIKDWIIQGNKFATWARVSGVKTKYSAKKNPLPHPKAAKYGLDTLYAEQSGDGYFSAWIYSDGDRVPLFDGKRVLLDSLQDYAKRHKYAIVYVNPKESRRKKNSVPRPQFLIAIKRAGKRLTYDSKTNRFTDDTPPSLYFSENAAQMRALSLLKKYPILRPYHMTVESALPHEIGGTRKNPRPKT